MIKLPEDQSEQIYKGKRILKKYIPVIQSLKLRRSQTTQFLLTIAYDWHRGVSGGILHNRVQSDGILPNVEKKHRPTTINKQQ